MADIASRWRSIARRIRVPLGFAMAALYWWLARPSWRFILAGAVVAFAGVAVRACASGHVKKNEELTTSGPYAYTRNPLYLGSIIIAAGFALASRNPWIAVILIALFLVIYLPVIRSEEEYLRSRFPEFEDYCSRVPRMLPRLRPAPGTQGGSFSAKLYLQHREYNALIGAAAMIAALALKIVLYPQ